MPFGRGGDEETRAARDEQRIHKQTERYARWEADKQAKMEAQEAVDRPDLAPEPAALAQAAYDRGDGFFELVLTLGTVAGYVSIVGNASNRTRTSHTDVLSQVEAIGWKLEHAGYVWVETFNRSRDKLLSSGQEVAVSGETQGIYLFRRVS
jgi:hypothetical protein